MAINSLGKMGLVLVITAALAGCEDGANFPLFQKKPGQDAQADGTTATTVVERDVEAPDVFSVTDQGLWDGRPSLGGVWVAHDDAENPERVIIRNTQNNKFVIGALFKRERSNPGPALQVSSDAADALGMLAGAPTELSVIALRREEVPVEAEVEEPMMLDGAETIETQTLDGDPLASASAAIDAAEAAAQPPASSVISPPAETAAAAPAAAAKPPAPASKLDRPFIQIGIFSVEANANRTAEMMRKAGVVPTIKPGETSGKKFWRVVVGPATNAAERGVLLKKVKGLGFTDAYAVTN